MFEIPGRGKPIYLASQPILIAFSSRFAEKRHG
jgi:hypothetical protein